MSYVSANHYHTSSLSDPVNSPFTQTAALARSAAGAFNPNSSAALQQTSVVQPTAPFTVRPDLDPLAREQREIERRRGRLEDRKQRVLHAKTRIMGVDVEALNEQVRERQERERLQQERDLYHDDLQSHHSKVLSGLEEERKVQERIQKEQLNFYRQQQATEKRVREQRTASGWSNMAETRTNFLNFTGEDKEKHLRDRAQAEQQRDWLAQQLATLSDKEARERQDEADLFAQQQNIIELKKQNELDKAAQAAARNRATQEYNLQQAAQKSNTRARFASQNQLSNTQELNATLTSALLNEAVPTSALGEHRSIPYHFKGFSSQQRQAIVDAQHAQVSMNADKRIRERLEEADYAAQNESVRRDMIRVDRAREEYERARLLALRDERAHQHKQKTLRDQYHNNVVYTNPVREEYFQQFGTSGR